MTCVCGAAKTYKACTGSNLHSDWCDDSPVFIARALAAKPKVKLVCYANELWGTKHGPPTVTVEYPNDIMLHGSYAGKTRHFCDNCCPVMSIIALNKKGCTVKKAGTEEILRP